MPRDKFATNEGWRSDAAFVRGCGVQLGIELVCAFVLLCFGVDHTLHSSVGSNGCCHGGARRMVNCWVRGGCGV